MIEIAGVWKEFAKGERRVLALQDISLRIAPSEFAAILGPSGCGKSTLLNMVAGFDLPTRGTVRVAGEEILQPSPKRAVVFQEPALFPWLSVMENVLFGPKTQGQPAASTNGIHYVTPDKRRKGPGQKVDGCWYASPISVLT